MWFSRLPSVVSATAIALQMHLRLLLLANARLDWNGVVESEEMHVERAFSFLFLPQPAFLSVRQRPIYDRSGYKSSLVKPVVCHSEHISP